MQEKKKKIDELKKKLSPILEKLLGTSFHNIIGHLIVVKPEDPISYMLHFLEKQKGIATK